MRNQNCECSCAESILWWTGHDGWSRNYLFIKAKVKSTLVNAMNFREKSVGVIKIIIHFMWLLRVCPLRERWHGCKDRQPEEKRWKEEQQKGRDKRWREKKKGKSQTLGAAPSSRVWSLTEWGHEFPSHSSTLPDVLNSPCIIQEKENTSRKQLHEQDL